MFPILYQCSFFTVYTYGVFVAVAFAVSTTLLAREARKRRLDESLIYNLCLVLLVSGIISARLLYVSLNWSHFRDDLLEIFLLQHGGLVWFGGLVGAVVGALGFMRLYKMPLLETIDLLAPYAALAQSIGRIGCFFNGCCYGKEDVYAGIYFPVHGRALFPVQLVDSLALLAIYLFLKNLPAGNIKGRVFSLYLILAGLERFLVEFLRGDERVFYLGLSVFQWISLLVGTTGLCLYSFLIWKKKST